MPKNSAVRNICESATPANPIPIPRAAYVHVPFCIHRCGYCDFTVIAGRDDLIDRYLAALERELALTLPGPVELDTLFIGGGTPSYLDASHLTRLFQILDRWLPRTVDAEFSIECNPDQFTDDRMSAMFAAGVNRISLGVQSFDARHLVTLERRHSTDAVESVVQRLRRHGFRNVSLDLIYAVPGQSSADWERTLTAAIDLAPEHISTYGLTYEKGTAFWSRRSRGVLQQVDDELERTMYALAMEFLPARGFPQYELSNFARPGWECRHNRVYWNQDPYYGFGPGAAGNVGTVRSTNHRSVTRWLAKIEGEDSGVQESEVLSPELRAREAVMLGLRQTAGIDLAEFRSRHGVTVCELAPDVYERFIGSGWLEEAENHLRLTLAGRFFADTVVAEFL